MRQLKAIVAASALLLFIGLGRSTIWDANEAFYAETPRQMVQSGDYVNPSFNGAPRFNKPVLSYWIVAGFYKIFGVSVWAERIPIAIGALGIAAAAFVIARTLWSARAGWIAAMVILTAPRVVFFARRIFIDIWITLFMSLVLMFFVLAEAYPGKRRRFLVLMYAAAGLGVLTKGPVAVALPAIAFGLYLIGERRFLDLRRMMLIPGALVVLAIVVPWYAMVYQQHGWDYITSFFIGENLGRYSETVGMQSRPFYFYLPVLLSELFPWSLFLPAALVMAWKRAAPGKRILLWWTVVIVGIFTFSSTKQDLYIFPIVAALAALIAGVLDDAIEGVAPAARYARWTWPVIGVLLLVLWIVLQQLFGTTGSKYFIRGAFFASIFLMAGAITLFGFWRARREIDAVITLGFTFAVVNYMLVLVSLPDFERFKPVAPLSAAANARNASAHVVQYKVALPSMVWYLGRPIEEVLDPGMLRERLVRQEETLVLLRESDYEEVKPLAPTCVVDSRPLLDVKPREIIADTALPQMLLISNRCN